MQTVLKTNKTAQINSQETWLATNITNWLPWFSLSATLLHCFCLDKCNKCLASRFGWCTHKKMLEIKFKYFSVVIFYSPYSFETFFPIFKARLLLQTMDRIDTYFFLKLNLSCGSLQKQPFLLSRDLWGYIVRRNVCDSATQIPYSWHNQCLQNSSRSHGVRNANLFNFTFLLVNFGEVLCSSAKELQQNSNAFSREEYIPQILTVLLLIHHVYIWHLYPFVCHSKTRAKTM